MIIFNHLLLMTGLDDVASSILRQMDSSADDDGLRLESERLELEEISTTT